MAQLKNAYEHLVAIQERLCKVPSDMYITWMGVHWMQKYVEQDWPWSTMALKPSPKLAENGKKMDQLTTPGVMYAMVNYKLPDKMQRVNLMWNGKKVTEMRLCVSYDDVRRDRAGNEPPFFFVPAAYFKDYMDLNNCKYCSHCLLLPIESPEERLKLVSDKEWFNSFQKLNKCKCRLNCVIFSRPNGQSATSKWLLFNRA